jgi:hypothetical protein
MEWIIANREDKNYTEQAGHNLIQEYHRTYFPESLAECETELHLEAMLSPKDGIVYHGYVDLLARGTMATEDGELFLLEHKTSSRKPSEFEARAPQALGYAWLAYMARNEIPKTVLNYLINTKKPTFQRILAATEEEQIEEWKCNTVHVIRSMRETYTVDEHYQNWGHCQFYGRCEYADICFAPAGQRDKIIQKMYIPREII